MTVDGVGQYEPIGHVIAVDPAAQYCPDKHAVHGEVCDAADVPTEQGTQYGYSFCKTYPALQITSQTPSVFK
jgi:hypothetical protein